MELIQEFEESVNNAKNLPDQANEVLLKFYGLYKQATEGDVNIEKPSNMFDFKGIAKFNAWEALKGMSKEEAMRSYIQLVKSLQ
ncbi:MAG: acyl-CoA-binding protein [Cytophagaceae bacterium]|jgi:acyl-CoA-binding protein|nr:acyl-CoA-binding protein [Cytophagaceae bacterium]